MDMDVNINNVNIAQISTMSDTILDPEAHLARLMSKHPDLAAKVLTKKNNIQAL